MNIFHESSCIDPFVITHNLIYVLYQLPITVKLPDCSLKCETKTLYNIPYIVMNDLLMVVYVSDLYVRSVVLG